MQVLVALAAERPNVISRDQLIDSCWNGRIVGSASINRCILALRNLAKQIAPEPFKIETVPRVGYSLVEQGCGPQGDAQNRQLVTSGPAETDSHTKRRDGALWALLGAGIIVLTLAFAALLFWKPFATGASVAVAAVSPADSSPASRDLARDLLAKLGALQLVGADAVELVSGLQRKRADLLFEVGGSTEARQTHANIVLMQRQNGSVLWSKDFRRPAEQAGDLRQEVAYTAAQVLECALEAHPRGRSILKTDALRLYLNGCAGLADAGAQRNSFLDLIPLFRQVIVTAPKFEGAWSKLLIVEDDAYAVTGDAVFREQLNRDIAAARLLIPDLAAAYTAQMHLLPLTAYAERMRLVDRAIAAHRDDPLPLSARSEILFSVGRLNEAIGDAQRAAQLNPLSPRLREGVIGSLADAGRMEAALTELAKAERLWPNSGALAGVRFRIHLRYGDPRIARHVIRSGAPAGWRDTEPFLQARIDPTPEKIERAINDARLMYERHPGTFQNLVQTLSIFDREPELLELLMRVPKENATYVTDVMFRPAAREFWRDPHALSYAKRVGLLQYWHTSGEWPDFCFETDLSYDCRKEAAKLLA